MNPRAVNTHLNRNLNLKHNLFGWRNFRCNGILSKPLFAYVLLCMCTFIQNFSVNGANNAVISTLERAFYMDSVQSGVFLCLYDLATVFSAPLIGYLGNLYSSPVFFSFNMIVVSMGNILIASSNFANRNNKLNFGSNLTSALLAVDTVLFQCSKDPIYTNNQTDSICSREENQSDTLAVAKFLLYSGNFVNGLGSVALFTVGVVYIERIFPRDKAAYCQGIYVAVGTVGGALGIVATGRFLLLFTKLTPRRRLPPWLTTSHPLWIGCWWLPYFIYGSICFVMGCFVSGLPNFATPGRQYVMKRNNPKISIISHQHQNPSINEEESPTDDTTVTTCPPTPRIDHSTSDTCTDLKTNKITSLKVTKSENSMNTKYIHHLPLIEILSNSTPGANNRLSIPSAAPSSFNQPQTSTEESSTICSTVLTLAKNTRYVFIVVANLFEGILLKGFVPFVSKYFEYQHQLDTSTATMITGAIALLSVIIGCPLSAYFMNKYSWTPMTCARICSIILTISSLLFLFLSFSCSELKFQATTCSESNRRCCRDIYHPVCDTDNPRKMYLSPCHFGCTTQTRVDMNSTSYYTSCHCGNNIVLSENVCRFRRVPCIAMFSLTILGAAFVVFFTAFVQVPMLQVLLYSVPQPLQSMALSLRQTTVRVLGQTTGPLLFGFVFDQSCLVWLSDCYERRTCKVYDNRRMGLSMALSGFSIRLIAGISCCVVYFHWRLKTGNHEDPPSSSSVPVVENQMNSNGNDEMTRL